MTVTLLRPQASTAAHLLDGVVAQVRGADRAACSSAEGALSYVELWTRVEAFAAGLAARGVGVNDIVAVDAARGSATIALVLAILQRGAAYLPLDADLPVERRRRMLDDARPVLAVGEQFTAQLLGDVCPHCTLGELPSAAAASALQRGELAYVLFTSGSTGTPKGVAMRASALAGLMQWHAAHPRLGRAARTLQFAPLGFDVSFQEIVSTLATGGSLVLPDDKQRRDPWALLDLIERAGIQRLFLPYVALQSLAEAVATDGRSAPACLIDVITAGEQLRITPAIRALFAALPGCVLHNHYGPTEAHVVTAYELTGDSALWPELPPIGKPLPHARVRVVDAAGADLATGEGELLLGGGCLAQGYLNRPELTAERFVEIDGVRWYRTGDGVRRNAQGDLEYLGRLDDQIKLAGYRIEPAEIEAVLGRHAQVAAAAVVAVGQAADKRLVAHVVPRNKNLPDAELTQSLRTQCEAALAAYMVPQQFIIHAALPLTASGKIDRRLLAGSEGHATIAWDDDAPLAAQLGGLWRQLLDLAEVEPHANLFDLGARSLTVVHALTELRRRGHVLSVVEIYEHPSVAAQAALLGAGKVNTATVTADDQRGERQRAALARFARPGGPR
jgi:amino acid adenylation domain-containing protein